MSKKLTPLLGNIVGELRKKMADWLLTWGNLFFPASLVFMLLGFGL